MEKPPLTLQSDIITLNFYVTMTFAILWFHILFVKYVLFYIEMSYSSF